MKKTALIVAGLLIVAALVGAWVFLYKNTHSVDVSAKNDFQTAVLQFKALDATWNVNVLRSYADLNASYDPLKEPLIKGRALIKTLGRLAKEQGRADVDKQFEVVEKLFKEKTELIELFKSQNSVLKNSVRYLPKSATESQALLEVASQSELATMRDMDSQAALTELEKTLQSNSQGEARVAASLARLRNHLDSVKKARGASSRAIDYMRSDSRVASVVTGALRYNILTDVESAIALAGALNGARAALEQRKYPAGVEEAMENVINHASIILGKHKGQVDLVSKIQDVPLNDAVSKLSTAFAGVFDDQLATQDKYRKELVAYSGFLGLLLAGALGFVVWTVVTERRRLAAKVTEATAKLERAEASLVNTEKMATLGEVSAGIAHEINTPLGYLSSGLETIADEFREFIAPHVDAVSVFMASVASGDKNAYNTAFRRVQQTHLLLENTGTMGDVGQLLGDCHEGTKQIAETVSNLQTYSRVDRAKVAEFQLEDGLESVLRWSKFKLMNVKVVRNFGKTPPVYCDLSQLNQVFMNLISNAADAAPKEGGQIVISTKTLPGNKVCVSVADNGHGIDPEILPRVFDKFFTTKGGNGTGLGLALSKQVVAQHGGDIAVVSEVNKGTTFTVTLPIVAKVSETTLMSEEFA